jgi:phage-related holin
MFVAIVGFFAPIHTLMLVVVALVILDLITGMMAAHKKQEKISSAGIRRTVSKFLVFEVAILAGFLIQYILKDLIPIANLVAGVIALTEGKSLFENLNVIYGQDLFTKVITNLGSVNDTKKKESN